MKTLHYIICSIGILLVLGACTGKDYSIKTAIYADGSCDRSMVLRLDSANAGIDNYFIPIDSSWTQKMEYEWDSLQNKTLAKITVEKHFPSIKAMNQEFYREDDTTGQANIRMELKRTFLWFYTKYRYEETFIQFFPFHHYPINDYITDQELEVYIIEDPVADSIYHLGVDSLERTQLEHDFELRLDTFIRKNVFEEFFESMESAVKKQQPDYFLSHPLKADKKKMYELLGRELSMLGEENYDQTVPHILTRLDSLYQTTAFTGLYYDDPAAFKSYNRKVDWEYFLNEKYEHELLMPGTLINSNSPAFRDGNPFWQFEYTHYALKDYTMWAESKRSNNWAFWVTVVIIILAFSLLILRKKPK